MLTPHPDALQVPQTCPATSMIAQLAFLLTAVPAVTSAGVYNSSTTPSGLPWNTYNYCNAPHVTRKHYVLPDDPGAKLVYLNAVMRHHKVCSSARVAPAHALIHLLYSALQITFTPMRTH